MKMNNVSDAQILIIDAGAQYGKVINRKIEELGVKTVFLPLTSTFETLSQYSESLKGVIISGGPGVGTAETADQLKETVFKLDFPILGICFGNQIIASAFGSTVESTQAREDGQFRISVDISSPLFSGMKEEQEVLVTHGYGITKLGPDLRIIATSDGHIQGVQHNTKAIYGVQFHPEVDLTIHGREIMRNFCYKICGIAISDVMKNRQALCLEDIRSSVQDRTVLALLSGGVDSTVLAALLTKALGAGRVLAIHIDNGLMRKNESTLVVKALKALGLDVKRVDCAYRFLNGKTWVHLEGCKNAQLSECLNTVVDPEQKRRIIGDVFMQIMSELLNDLDKDKFVLAQGTLAPDLIESGSKLSSSMADTIKTHHNDSPLAREFRNAGKIIEPLRTFYKDEVRELGRELSLPAELVNRHPFPGPGLGPRIICQLDLYPWYLENYNDFNNRLNLICSYHRLRTTQSQMLNSLEAQLTDAKREFLISLKDHPRIYPVLLPVRTVGVQGDGRTYSYAAAFSCETGAQVKWDVLSHLTKLVTMLCPNVNRCCFVFGDKIEGPVRDITPTLLNPGAISRLREADSAAMDMLRQHDALKLVSQMPVVLLPLHFDRASRHDPSTKHSIVLRPFVTSDFMTGSAAIPGKHIPEPVVNDIVAAVSGVLGISRVMYDLTDKPPGTTEWE
ncbi:GMP synthase [glutamine-hydrolyzing]-like isoform X3 [Bolinopsis microptera]|uniref:GMP synthase [glutamine-hydrolyzing]-like isoform X1 n=1 Tax=Bolinopsis microptera TaxID=2820187 RepID=UPI003078D1BD